MKLILFNGPPRSGKDTAALAAEEFLCKLPSNPIVAMDKFSFPNKAAFAGMMREKIYEDFSVHYYEENKEKPIPCLGVSYRQWQIDFSEKFMKPLYGEDVFARLLLERNYAAEPQAQPNYLVVSDCGFQVEVDTLLKHETIEAAILIRCRRDGCDFSKDSRNFVYIRPQYDYNKTRRTLDARGRIGRQIDLYNNGTIDEWRSYIVRYVRAWAEDHE